MLRMIDNVIYTARTHTVGGRDGRGRSSDGQLDVVLTPPALGRPGTNPEQLLGIAWSGCFIGAMKRAGLALGIKVPSDVEIDAQVQLGQVVADKGFALAMRMTVRLPGLDVDDQLRLVEGTHERCAFSLAMRGNIDVQFEVV